VQPRKVLVLRTAAVCGLLILTACGAPGPVRTLDGEPDLARIDSGALPSGFSRSANEELTRLRDACIAIDPEVGAVLPEIANAGDVTHLGLVDAQCEWGDRGVAGTGPPELIVGILANPGGGTALDQTASVLEGEREVAAVGERAMLDPQTRTLYVLKHSRLWYLQLPGPRAGVAAPDVLIRLGRALMQTPRSD
jgi:hypothetical protein